MGVVVWTDNTVRLGDDDYGGQAVEGTLELKRKMIDFGAMGLPADVRLPSGRLEAPTVSIKVENVSPADIRKFIGLIDLKMVGKCKVLKGDSGLVEDDNMTTRIKGYAETVPTQPTKNEKADLDITIAPYFVEISSDKLGTVLKVNVPDGIIEPEDLAG